MSSNLALPVEIYLPILEYIDDLATLAALCNVDRGEHLGVQKIPKQVF
jgi:hypothetical protein